MPPKRTPAHTNPSILCILSTITTNNKKHMAKSAKLIRAIALIERLGGTLNSPSSNQDIYKQVAALGYRWNTPTRQWERVPQPAPDGQPLPCPFCGGQAQPQHLTHHFIACTRCGATGPASSRQAHAVTLWNRRIC
jgi:Lar family restriction alleviation protein